MGASCSGVLQSAVIASHTAGISGSRMHLSAQPLAGYSVSCMHLHVPLTSCLAATVVRPRIHHATSEPDHVEYLRHDFVHFTCVCDIGRCSYSHSTVVAPKQAFALRTVTRICRLLYGNRRLGRSSTSERGVCSGAERGRQHQRGPCCLQAPSGQAHRQGWHHHTAAARHYRYQCSD